MSDKARREEETRPKVPVQPVPSRPDLVEFLESLWRPDFTITRLEIRMVRLRNENIERLGPIRPPYTFSPNAARPSRSELVTMANEIVFAAQTHCNGVGKKKSYGIIAYQFGSDSDYVGMFVIRCSPKESSTEQPDGIEGDSWPPGEDGHALVGPTAPLLNYSLQQNQQALEDRRFFLKVVTDLTESVVGHLTSMHEQQAKSIADKDRIIADGFERQIKLMEATERLISQEHDRKLKARWTEVGVSTVEKGAEMVLGLVPPMINRIAGKEVVETRSSIESVVAANFVKSVTPEQAKEAFGYQGEGQPPYANCIFSREQGEILMAVAACKLPGDRVYELAPDSGSPLALRGDQLTRAQAVFSMEQLWPIVDLFQQRTNKQSAQSVPSSPKP